MREGIPDPVLTGVKENAVHSFSGLVLDPKKQWRWEANGYQKDNRWYIKPRMRIDSADAFGTAKNVIKIVVRSFDGEIVYEKNISTDRFIGQNGYYGRFLEDFFTNGISVPANSTGTGINRAFLRVLTTGTNTNISIPVKLILRFTGIKM
ncbi:MAG: hypothetical protein IPG99_20270 [Ignavibacteria bacterium]|nr:hypothetical protein [Ignavibacteria bacterium]